jgi:O-antigen/teichoic acid export membrane protein
MLAGVLGIAFQSLVSHRLQPNDYGAVFAVVSLITFVGLPATAFTLVMAREASRDRALGDTASSASLLWNGNRSLLATGIGLGLVLAATSPLLAQFLFIPPSLVVAAAAGMPFALALPLLLGELQGEQRFVDLSVVLVGLAALKLAASLALGAIWGPIGIIAGISVASAVVYVLAWARLSLKAPAANRKPWVRSAVRYLAVILPSTIALAVLLSADVILVKHFFPTRVAGEYAAVAALGRAIFWGASAVATVLFPKVVFSRAQGRAGTQLVAASLGLVAFGGIAGLALLSVGSRAILVAFSGGAYAAAAGYLAWYAVGMIMLGAAAVLIASHQSRGHAGFLALLVPLSILEPVLVAVFHQTLAQVVLVVDISMTIVAVTLGALLFAQRESGTWAPAMAPTATINMTGVSADT